MIDIVRDTYLNRSKIPKRYLGEISLTPEKIDLQAFRELSSIEHSVKEFVHDGNNLFIFSSNVGNGKTSWAIKIGKAYINYASDYAITCPVLFINVAAFLAKKKAAISDPSLKDELSIIEKNILSARLVIWDDIAVKGLSDYDKEQLYVWIETRTSENKSNIYTSNIIPDDLENILGARLFDRILNYSTKIEFKGQSRRK